MRPAWRGVVLDGEVWAWPMLLLTHVEAFAVLPVLSRASCRWRQWEPDGRVDFDPGCTDEERALVQAWVDSA